MSGKKSSAPANESNNRSRRNSSVSSLEESVAVAGLFSLAQGATSTATPQDSKASLPSKHKSSDHMCPNRTANNAVQASNVSASTRNFSTQNIPMGMLDKGNTHRVSSFPLTTNDAVAVKIQSKQKRRQGSVRKASPKKGNVNIQGNIPKEWSELMMGKSLATSPPAQPANAAKVKNQNFQSYLHERGLISEVRLPYNRTPNSLTTTASTSLSNYGSAIPFPTNKPAPVSAPISAPIAAPTSGLSLQAALQIVLAQQASAQALQVRQSVPIGTMHRQHQSRPTANPMTTVQRKELPIAPAPAPRRPPGKREAMHMSPSLPPLKKRPLSLSVDEEIIGPSPPKRPTIQSLQRIHATASHKTIPVVERKELPTAPGHSPSNRGEIPIASRPPPKKRALSLSVDKEMIDHSMTKNPTGQAALPSWKQQVLDNSKPSSAGEIKAKDLQGRFLPPAKGYGKITKWSDEKRKWTRGIRTPTTGSMARLTTKGRIARDAARILNITDKKKLEVSSAHTKAVRSDMTALIIARLRQLNWREDLRALSQLARVLEERLYTSSTTLEEYSDRSTLDQRLKLVCVMFGRKVEEKRRAKK